jgi:hypothetical protein
LNIFERFYTTFEYFYTVFEYFHIVFVRFHTVFERFCLTYLAQLLQINFITLVFTPKINVPLQNSPPIFPVFHNFWIIPNLQFLSASGGIVITAESECKNLPRISDIYQMETITFNPPQTKQCPFCAETIQAAAIKCRFCNEFLNTNKAKALQADPISDSQLADDKKPAGSILFEGKPSLWAMTPTAIRGLFFLAIAALLIFYPLEKLSIVQRAETPASPVAKPPAADAITEPAAGPEIAENSAEKTSRLALNEQQLLLFHRYRIAAGLGLVMLVMLILSTKMARLKTTRYEVSAERIEWGRGLLDRRVDNLDMFRVIDLKLRRSLLDCIVGVGTVTVITTDKTDPEFTFEKIRNPRKLYDIIKKASLEADRRGSVIHLE